MKTINLDAWDRKEHYLFFQRMDYPHYHLGTDLDITHFKKRTKEKELPFSFALTYAVTKVMNQIEAFRFRRYNGELVIVDELHPSFAYVAPNMKYFKMVTVNMTETIETFAPLAKNKALQQDRYFIPEEINGRADLIYISSIPKVSFTHLSHTINLNKEDSVPRLSWGKYYTQEDRLILPFNLQAHHGFIDGDHMGTYLESLQNYLNEF